MSSQKSQRMFLSQRQLKFTELAGCLKKAYILGSELLVTLGSTRAGPGLTKKVSLLLYENQIRQPARCGIWIVVLVPGPPMAIEQSFGRGWHVELGEGG